MKNHLNVNMKSWTTDDISENICSFESTTHEGNTYQDLMGFGELWVNIIVETVLVKLSKILGVTPPDFSRDKNKTLTSKKDLEVTKIVKVTEVVRDKEE